MFLNQSIMSDKLHSSVTRNNQTITSMLGQLKGLTLNKFCQNRWVYHQGTCYYFSKAQVQKYTYVHLFELLYYVRATTIFIKLISNLINEIKNIACCDNSSLSSPHRRQPPGPRLVSSVASCTPLPASRCQKLRRPTSSWPRSTPTSPRPGTLCTLTCECRLCFTLNYEL